LTYPAFEYGGIYVNKIIRMAKELIVLYVLVGVVRRGALRIEDGERFVQELNSASMHVFDI